MPPPSFPIRLVSWRALSPAVRELVFEREDGGPMQFAPGQWLNFSIPGPHETEILRAYSIASSPTGSPRFEIAVTRIPEGPGSTFLHALAPGVPLRAIGPQGFFTRDVDNGSPSLFVATGTGITPLRSMLRAAVEAGATEPLWLLLGVRHEADILYRDELEALCASHPNVRTFVTLSRPGPDWQGRSGYVQAHIPELWRDLCALSPASDPPHLYVCGLERMVKTVRDLVRKDLGAPRQQVHSERYD
jgi:CDP-4-dehydro-6-deoxyglucose reductase